MASSWKPWIAYCVTIGVIFTAIKLINAYLHRLFDFGECVVEETSSHKSDDETFGNETNPIEQNDNILNNSERKENIEMIVIADNNNMNNCERSDSLGLYLNNSNNNTINNNNNLINSSNVYNSNDYLETSVIDLEVDVHHRNSSGSSIGVSSERSKSQSEAVINSEIAVTNSSTITTTTTGIFVPNTQTLVSELGNCDTNVVTTHKCAVSAINLTNESSQISDSFDALTKGTSLEMGFMAQDPAVLRAQANHNNDLQSNRKRADTAVVRRARSELETTQCSSDKKVSSLPPSHPVSLEIIGTSGHDNDLDLVKLSNNDNDLQFSDDLRKTTPNLNDKSSLINEQNIDNQMPSNPNLNSLKLETVKTSPVLSDNRTRSVVKPESLVEDSSHSKIIQSSDYDEGDESDVSLVVNYSTKIKKRKTPKVSKPRRTLNRRKVSKSCSSGKISTSNKKSTEKMSQFSSDTTSTNELSKRFPINYSSESDIESSHNGSNSYTSRSSTSLTSSHSSVSINDEKTPLTSSIAEPEVKTSSLTSRNNSIALEPKCIAGPSKQLSYDINSSEISKRMSHIMAKNDTSEYEHELERLRNDLQRRRKRSKRGEPFVYSHQNTDPSELINDNIAGASLSNPLESSQNASAENGPPPYLLARLLSVPGTHLAKSHEDTNVGAVHVFQDERGNWLTYTFDEKSSGVARGLMNSDKALIDIELYSAMQSQAATHKWNSSSSSSGSTVVLDSPANVLHTPKMLQTGLLHSQFGDGPNDFSRALQPNANTLFADSFPSESIHFFTNEFINTFNY
jgi:hypothetical protein